MGKLVGVVVWFIWYWGCFGLFVVVYLYFVGLVVGGCYIVCLVVYWFLVGYDGVGSGGCVGGGFCLLWCGIGGIGSVVGGGYFDYVDWVGIGYLVGYVVVVWWWFFWLVGFGW